MAGKGMDVFDEVGHLGAKDPGVPESTQRLLKQKATNRIGHKTKDKGKKGKPFKASSNTAAGTKKPVLQKKISNAMGY